MSFVALVFMVLLTYYPALTMAAISNNAHRLESVETRSRIGELYGETVIQKNRTVNQFFTSLFLFRRLIYVMILVLLKNYPLL